jgi:hypothetical protein
MTVRNEVARSVLRPAAMLLLSAFAVARASAEPALSAAPVAFGVADRSPILIVHAVGAQIYECKPDASGLSWTFREPIAALFEDGETVGRHYAGPTWSLVDGGAVKGKVVATAPGATVGDVTQLKLDVVQHEGNGKLNAAASILRLNTRGGVLKGPCAAAGELRAEPYSADYVFLR